MKKLLAFLLVAVLSISMMGNVVSASASGFTSKNDIAKQNEVNIAKYADSFVESIYPKGEHTTGDVTTMYNEDDAVSGYCIDILVGTIPNGYVVVKFANNNPVVSEFCLEPTVTNPYKEIIKHYDIKSENLRYYSIGPNEYHVCDLTNELVLGFSNDVCTIADFVSYKNAVKQYKLKLATQTEESTREGEEYLNYSSLDGWSVVSDNYTGSVKSSHTITGAGSLTYYCSPDVSAIGETYACSIVALCNLMRYYRSRGFTQISSSFDTLYTTMWSYAGTSATGSTTNGNEAPAAERYLDELGYDCSFNDYWLDLYANFKSDLNKNKPCLFTYGAMFGNNAGGHATLAVGYVHTSSYKYLQIADGWNSYLRYINFNGYDYSRVDGWAFTLSN